MAKIKVLFNDGSNVEWFIFNDVKQFAEHVGAPVLAEPSKEDPEQSMFEYEGIYRNDTERWELCSMDYQIPVNEM